MTDYVQQFNVQNVKLDALVAMKLIQQANDSSQMSIGYLLGIVEGDTVQITNCFPIPNTQDSEGEQQQHDKYMMQHSRKHGLDNNKAGLYIISESQEQHLLQNFEYQHQIQSLAHFAVLLTYSKQMSDQGNPIPFQAFTISPKFHDLFLREEVQSADYSNLNSKYDKVYRQVPIELMINPLAQVNKILTQYNKKNDIKQKYQSSDLLKTNLKANTQLLQDTLDEEINLSQKLSKDALEKKQVKFDGESKIVSVNDILEYFLAIHRINSITEQIKKQTNNIIESKSRIYKLIQ